MSSVKKSFFWSAVEQVGPRLMQLVIGLTLARLLDPEAFGLVGMLALFLAVAQVFSDSGLSASLIQRKTLTADDETSVCALNAVVGLGLSGLLCLISPLVAHFYQQPVLMPLLCVQSLSILFAALGIVQSALMVRHMQFRQTALIGTASTVASGVVGIGMAWLGCGVWSLVVSVVVASLVRMILYWTLGGWRPRGQVRWSCIRSLWGFSSYLLYCNLMGITWLNLYGVVIGKVYSSETLGFYDRANNWRMLPTGVMAGIVNRVAFPLFSRCQDDKPQLLRRIREIVRGSLMLSAGALALVAVVADLVIPLVLTPKWTPAVPLLRILCYAGVLYPINSLFLMALQAQGHSNLNFRLESIKMVNAFVALALAYRFGVAALAWSMVALTVVAYFLNAYYNVKLLGYGWQLQARDILPSLGLCAGAGWLSWWLSSLLPVGVAVILAARVVLFGLLCGAGIYTFRKGVFVDIWKHLIWATDKLRQMMPFGAGRPALI